MAGYEPLNTLKPMAHDVWVIDGPETRFHGAPIPARATVVRLDNGNIWIHSPVRLTPALRDDVAALGPVRHLIAPHCDLREDICDWQRAFAEARVWLVPGIDPAMDGETHLRPKTLGGRAETPWRGQIAQLIVEGRGSFPEPVFFHRASRSLILSNLIHNVETDRLPAWARPVVWIAGADYPDGGMPFIVKMRFRGRTEQLTDAVETMIGWNPERIILRHGKNVDRGGVEWLRFVFRRHLRDREWKRLLGKARGRAR